MKITKQQRRSFKWKELCMFCENKWHSGDRTLLCVASFDFCDTLEQRVNEKCDYKMISKVGDFRKVIANEARYHRSCHSKYVVHRKKTHVDSEAGSSDKPYQQAFDKLLEDIKPHIESGMSFIMIDLLNKSQRLLQDYITQEEAARFTTQKLKTKLEEQCSDFLSVISSGHGRKMIVVSGNLHLTDVINTAAELKKSFRNLQAETELSRSLEADQRSPSMILYHAALIVRSLRKTCVGIQHQPLDPEDVSQERAESLIPDELYTFVYWLLSKDEPTTLTNSVNVDDIKERNSSLHRHILSVCQDIVYIGSRSKCMTPKHVGLSIALHQLTQSREVVTLVNRLGHGISYNEVVNIDTCWAVNQITPDGYATPSNIVPGIPVRAAGDNFNRATETLDGQHLDVVNMVLYQPGNGSVQGTFGPRPKPVIADKLGRDIKIAQILECPRIGSKQPGPCHLLRKVNTDWFLKCSEEHEAAKAIDCAYIQLRLMPMKLFEADFQRTDMNQISGWTVYHATVTHKIGVPKTKIGYLPMIPASATEFDTIYTMMKIFQRQFKALGQEWTYVTYDEAIYSKAQMIKWRNVEEFQNDELDIGGMHRAMNFMGDIGRVMEESGLEDILVEANVYGPNKVQQIVRGKSYNRGVRTHKLLNEAMHRLKWTVFEDWMIDNEKTLTTDERTDIANDALRIIQMLQRDDTDSEDNRPMLQNALLEFQQHTASLNTLMSDFTIDGRSRSDTFLFWDNYVCFISQLLLDYIAAKRDGNRQLELETFAEMLPLDFMCGHTNYARWGTVNVIEGHLLKETKPDIHDSESSDNAAVYRTGRPFSGVWHDMGIEQSINRECGKFQHLYTREVALQKYYLTAHLKAAVTSMMKKMSGFLESNRELHT